jgi:CheY-like chemotaxis protein
MSIQPVLYAEDDENDVLLMERAFDILKIPQPLRTVSDGKMAIAYLSGNAPFSNREENPLPGLLLMDLSMPGKTGLEVLQWVRTQPTFATLPAVVLTSSNQESDIHRAYLLGANGFLIKPGDPDELLRMVKGLQRYWLTENCRPSAFVDLAAVKV